MFEGILVVFYLPDGSTIDMHRRFRKRIYGEETSSWGGRYHYRRKGLLDEISHVYLYTGVVIVRKNEEKRLYQTLKEHGAIIQKRRVILMQSDVRKLKKSA